MYLPKLESSGSLSEPSLLCLLARPEREVPGAMGILESDGVPGIDGVSSPVSTPRDGPIILVI